MAKLIIGLTIVLSAVQAFAGGVDPRFTYEAATNAYQDASQPTLVKLQANAWRMTGTVSYGDHSQDGYWPNGEVTLDGQPGHFHADASFTSDQDAFGNLLLTWNETFTGAESGVVYWNQVLAAALHSKAVIYTSPATSSACQTQNECRLVSKSNSLLCRMIVMDQRQACSAYPRNAVNRYRLFVPFAKP